MKIILSFIFAALFMICGLATVSNAQTTENKQSFEARVHQQEMRIAAGVKDGSLTQAEADRLQKREAMMRQMAVKFRESGGRCHPNGAASTKYGAKQDQPRHLQAQAQ